MERGLYIAAAGMLSEMVRQDQIANDLANTATNGYKPNRVAQREFDEVMLANTQTGQQVGALGRGPVISKQTTDFSQGDLKDTGEPLDFAIAGDGFFAVRTPQGVRYTRDGEFQAAANGTLTDQRGNAVLDAKGRPVQVKADGTVDNTTIGCFALANPRKAGDALFTGTARGQATGDVRGGVLEASGVDAGRTMVDMIASMRAYEASQKSITTIDSTLQLTAQQVGNLPG
jgi:flagellar basal-body rod protein FlgG